MELIAAVYEDWGIGANGTQPIALSADRKFFREMTRGTAVILGRRTMEDFPGQKPLPGRVNILLSRSGKEFPGFTVCSNAQEAMKTAGEKVMVIGGGSVYAQLLPYCTGAWITKLHTSVPCDTFLQNLDEDPQWKLEETVQSGTENGIAYEMCRYTRVMT